MPGPDLCRGTGTGEGVSYLAGEWAGLWFEWGRVIMTWRFLARAKGLMGSFTNTEVMDLDPKVSAGCVIGLWVKLVWITAVGSMGIGLSGLPSRCEMGMWYGCLCLSRSMGVRGDGGRAEVRRGSQVTRGVL